MSALANIGVTASAKKRFARAIISMLLAVFAPTSVLAGPLRYCLGQDGHRDIAFEHDDGRERVLGGPIAATDFPAFAHVRDASCEDRELFAQATKPLGARERFGKSRGGSATPAGLPALQRRGSPAPVRHGFPPCWTDGARDPRLISLRTVVLLN